MLHSPNIHRTTEEGPAVWIGEPAPVSAIESERHVPHPFFILILKGAQTRFYRSRAAFEEADRLLGKKPRMGFEYSAVKRQYLEATHDGYPMVAVSGELP